MFESIKRLFTQNGQHLKTQLSEAEALTIARDAAAGQPYQDALCLAKVEEQAGRLVWVVASATIGSGLEIFVDDETGEVISMKRVGVR